MTHWVNKAKEPSRTCLYLGDVPELLIILMVTMVPEVITNVVDFTQGFQKYMTHGVNNAKKPHRTYLYLEDVHELFDWGAPPLLVAEILLAS